VVFIAGVLSVDVDGAGIAAVGVEGVELGLVGVSQGRGKKEREDGEWLVVWGDLRVMNSWWAVSTKQAF
jgi:hypothetical protein